MSAHQPFPQLTAVLFDLDGTLVDSDDLAVASLARRLQPIVGKRAPDLARRFWMKAETPGNALITLLDIFHLDRPVLKVVKPLLGSSAKAGPEAFPLIPGVPEMLRRVHEQYQIGLVTTRGRKHINAFFAAHPDIAPLFDVSCGSQDTTRLKPHPAPVRKAARELGLLPTSCLMVGDTTMDVLSGRRAGARTVGVLCGYGEQPELTRAGADQILPTTAALADFLGLQK